MLFHNMKNYPEVNCDDIQRKIEDFVLHLINTPCKTGTRKRSGIMPYINALACFLDMNENRYYYRKKLKRIIKPNIKSFEDASKEKIPSKRIKEDRISSFISGVIYARFY